VPTYTADPGLLRALAVATGEAADGAMATAGNAVLLSGDTAVASATGPVAAWGQAWAHSLSERADLLDHPYPVAATVTDAAHLTARADAVDHALTTPLAVTWEAFDADVSAAVSAWDWLAAHQTPTVAAGFLATLDQATATAVGRRRPEIAEVSGVPLETVFAANRRRIELAIDEIDRRMAGADPWAGLAAERDTLTGLLHRSFVVFDWAGHGRIAEWVGPIDAEHIAVLLPGSGTDRGDVDRLAGDAARLLRLDGGGDLAMVTALVYDAPDLAAAILPVAAAEGIAGLAGLLGLLPASDRHLTLIGHSYGALLLGTALAAGLAADLPARHDIVLIGALGSGSRQAGDLGIDPARLWVGETTDDLVVDGRRVADLVGALEGPLSAFGLLSTVLDDTFGSIPTEPGFGATRFDAGAGGHSGYLAADMVSGHDGRFHRAFELASVSAAAIIAIATGRRFAIGRARKRTANDEDNGAASG